MKPEFELPGQFRSTDDAAAELGQLLASRGFFNFNGRMVHLVDVPGQESQFIEVTSKYLADYINREFQPVERVFPDQATGRN
jgi:hypothetical protein